MRGAGRTTPVSLSVDANYTMSNATSILQVIEFTAPVQAAIRALGADVELVLRAVNAELASAVQIKSDSSVTASAKTRKDGFVQVSGKQSGRFLIQSSHLVCIVQTDTWVSKAPPFVGCSVKFPISVEGYLQSARFAAQPETAPVIA